MVSGRPPRVCASSSSSATTCPPIRTRSRCRTSPVRGRLDLLCRCVAAGVFLARDRERVESTSSSPTSLRSPSTPTASGTSTPTSATSPRGSGTLSTQDDALPSGTCPPTFRPASNSGGWDWKRPSTGCSTLRYLQRVCRPNPCPASRGRRRSSTPRRRPTPCSCSPTTTISPRRATCSRTVPDAAYASVPSYSMPTTPSLSSHNWLDTDGYESTTTTGASTTAPATDDRFAVPLRGVAVDPETRALCPLGRPRRRGRAPVRLQWAYYPCDACHDAATDRGRAIGPVTGSTGRRLLCAAFAGRRSPPASTCDGDGKAQRASGSEGQIPRATGLRPVTAMGSRRRRLSPV